MSEPDRRKAFGARLRLRRNDLKLTRHRLAGKVGCSTRTISNWELGQSYPRRQSVFKLSRALDCDRTWLEGVPGASAPIFHDPEEIVRP